MRQRKLADYLSRAWYSSRLTGVSLLLWPLSLLFQLLVFLRRLAYRVKLFKSYQPSVPVIVVGNITVGGTGKTPMVIGLTQFLISQGFRPGVVSKGYGGSAIDSPQVVTKNSDPLLVGDEPVLIHFKVGCPVVVGKDRVAATQLLLNNNPDCDVVISDDGLQHYALARQIEIAMLDGERRCGNQLCLPAGPLREAMNRLQQVDFVVVTSGDPGREVVMKLQPERIYQLIAPERLLEPDELQKKMIHAVAGIANPQRFFQTLRAMKLRLFEHPFPDHCLFVEQDFLFADNAVIIMTEKDAVKCRAFAKENFYVLSVQPELPVEFGNQLLDRLRAVKATL